MMFCNDVTMAILAYLKHMVLPDIKLSLTKKWTIQSGLRLLKKGDLKVQVLR